MKKSILAGVIFMVLGSFAHAENIKDGFFHLIRSYENQQINYYGEPNSIEKRIHTTKLKYRSEDLPQLTQIIVQVFVSAQGVDRSNLKVILDSANSTAGKKGWELTFARYFAQSGEEFCSVTYSAENTAIDTICFSDKNK